MKKLFAILMLLLSLISTAFAATLEDDSATVEAEQTLNAVSSVQRYVYVMDRLNGTVEEFVIQKDADYLPVLLELDQGDLIATDDDLVKLNLQVQVKRYSEKAVAHKLGIVPISFKHLTMSEQKQHVNMENFSMYTVEEQQVQGGQNGPIIIDNQAGLENMSHFVNAVIQMKMVR